MYDIIYLGSFISIAGANPYPGMNRDQVIAQLHIGYRMPKPQYCSDEVWVVLSLKIVLSLQWS